MPKAIWNGMVIAETDKFELVEGNVYFPPETVKREHLKPSDTHTVCPWKGTASDSTVVVDGVEGKDTAWYYLDPKPAAAEIKDRIAFWKGVKVER